MKTLIALLVCVYFVACYNNAVVKEEYVAVAQATYNADVQYYDQDDMYCKDGKCVERDDYIAYYKANI